MENSGKNAVMLETMDVLVDGCKAKNGTLAEYSIAYLKTAVGSIDKGYFDSGSESLNNFIK